MHRILKTSMRLLEIPTPHTRIHLPLDAPLVNLSIDVSRNTIFLSDGAVFAESKAGVNEWAVGDASAVDAVAAEAVFLVPDRGGVDVFGVGGDAPVAVPRRSAGGVGEGGFGREGRTARPLPNRSVHSSAVRKR
jgi:hypothetical protein